MENATDGESKKALSFKEIFDLNEIQRLQDAFSAATGVASIITEPDGTPITHSSAFCSLCHDVIRKTEKGLSNCQCSDALLGSPNPGGPRIQRCASGGLMDAGASIMVEGRHIANWLVGQVLTEDVPEDELLAYADVIGVDRELYRKELRKVNRMSAQKFQDICNFLFINAQMLSKYAYKTLQLSDEILKRTEAEEHLRSANTQLEKWAVERTALLEESNCELTDLINLLEEEVVEREKSQKLYKELSLELENRVLQRTRELDDRNRRLDDANALFTAIYDSSSDIIVFALDKEYRYISFNENHRRAMKSAWGKDIELGSSILEIIGDHEDAHKFKANADRALSGERFIRVNFHSDGDSQMHWQNHWAPVISSNGAVIGLSCFSLNITDWIQAEEKLAVTEKLYSDIFSQSVIAVELYNENGLLIDANEACFNLVGVDGLKDMEGLCLFTNPNLDDDVKARLLNKETVHFTSEFNFSLAPYVSRFQGHRIFEWRIAPAVYENRTTGYICQVQDITERRRLTRTPLRPKWQL